MGAKISKCYSSYKLQPKVLKLFLNFPPNGPHKSMFGIFEILNFQFLTIFFLENFKFTTQLVSNSFMLSVKQISRTSNFNVFV